MLLVACNFPHATFYNAPGHKLRFLHRHKGAIVVGCFCPFAGAEVTYGVLNGQVVNETIKPAVDRPDEPDQISEFYQPYNTIEKVFGYVGKTLNEADETTIAYDSTYGFPTTVFVDWLKQAMDDEMYLTLSNFEPLP